MACEHSEFSEKLAEIMTRRDLTQRELARMIGVDETSLSRYINGTRKPCTDVLLRISQVLNVSVEYLMGKEEECSFNEIRNLLCSNLCHFTDAQRLELMELIARKQ